MHLGKSASTDYKSKTGNLLNAASPLKNFEFDFGLGGAGPSKGQPLSSLKDRKAQTGSASAAAPGPSATGTSYSASQPSWSSGATSTPTPGMGQSGYGSSGGPTPQATPWTHTPMSSNGQATSSWSSATSTPKPAAPQGAWTHVPAKGMASSSSSPASATPAASAGLTGAFLKDDSLADLWKTSVSTAKTPGRVSGATSRSSSFTSATGTGSPSQRADSFGSWGASLNPNFGQSQPASSFGASMPRPSTKASGSDPLASLTSPAPVSLASLKKAKASAATAKATATAAAAMTSAAAAANDGIGAFGMGSLHGALGTEGTLAGTPGFGGAAAPGAAGGATTVRVRVETATVEVGEIVDDDVFPAPANSGQTAGMADPFGDMFGGGAAPPPSTSYGGGDGNDFDDFQSSGPIQRQQADSDFSAFDSGPAGFDPVPPMSAPNPPSMADPFAASQDPFAFGSSTPAPTSTQNPAASADPFASVFGTPSAAPAASAVSSGDPFASAFGSASTQVPQNADPFAALYGASSGAAGGGGGGGPPQASRPVDPLEALLMKPRPQVVPPPAAPEAPSALSGGGDDWGVSWGDFQESSEPTRELDDVGSAPPGVTSQSALRKGSEFYKGGQFADAIKWLLWAEQLCEAGGEGSMLIEVLSTRATCYKEAGEMKKAVADCTKVIELLPTNTVILMQRALLYESMEKYKAGVEDLRTVSRLDPSNRQAAQILNRLNKAVANS